MQFTIAAVLALAGAAAALPSPTGHTLHEKREASSPKWVKRDKLPSDAIIPMRVGLAQRNIEQGHDFLMDVYVDL